MSSGSDVGDGDGSHDHARPRYLTAKVSVDDRARDRRVLKQLLDSIPDRPRVGEAGCGTGLSVPTLYEWGVTPRSYRGVDTDPGVVAFARSVVPRVLRRLGYGAIGTHTGCRVDGSGAEETTLTFEVGDALTALHDDSTAEGFDLVLAQSFLDLVPAERALDALGRVTDGEGLVYAPLTFDGETIFLPEHPADERVVEAFHAGIDAVPGRDSRAGRHLLDRLRERGARVEAVAASDWIVRPSPSGGYPADERYFLACILGFVAESLAGIDGGEEWLETRRHQLCTGELTYIAHGYDLLWRPGEAVTDR